MAYTGRPKGVCDRCDFEFHLDELRPDGEKPGLLVCRGCWDPRHPQRDIRSVKDRIAVPNARPPKPIRFVEEPIDPTKLGE